VGFRETTPKASSVFIETSAGAEVIAERQSFLLFDDGAFMSARRRRTDGGGRFLLGLKQRFRERDGMHFSRSKWENTTAVACSEGVAQLTFYVEDDGLRSVVGSTSRRGPQTYSRSAEVPEGASQGGPEQLPGYGRS